VTVNSLVKDFGAWPVHWSWVLKLMLYKTEYFLMLEARLSAGASHERYLHRNRISCR